MNELITAIGLVLILEGLVYGAFPAFGKQVGEMLRTTPEETLRLVGIGCAIVGFILVWAVRG
ncbi:MAG: DUF2065 domain-containing protein [Ahrensia sp.]